MNFGKIFEVSDPLGLRTSSNIASKHFCLVNISGFCWNHKQKSCRCIPGSSKCVKFVPIHPKNLPKGRNFTYLEDTGITLGKLL